MCSNSDVVGTFRSLAEDLDSIKRQTDSVDPSDVAEAHRPPFAHRHDRDERDEAQQRDVPGEDPDVADRLIRVGNISTIAVGAIAPYSAKISRPTLWTTESEPAVGCSRWNSGTAATALTAAKPNRNSRRPNRSDAWPNSRRVAEVALRRLRRPPAAPGGYGTRIPRPRSRPASRSSIASLTASRG
jgi:hypothetical protein